MVILIHSLNLDNVSHSQDTKPRLLVTNACGSSSHTLNGLWQQVNCGGIRGGLFRCSPIKLCQKRLKQLTSSIHHYTASLLHPWTQSSWPRPHRSSRDPLPPRELTFVSGPRPAWKLSHPKGRLPGPGSCPDLCGHALPPGSLWASHTRVGHKWTNWIDDVIMCY